MAPGQQPSDHPTVPGPIGGYRNAPVSDPAAPAAPAALPALPAGGAALVVDFGALTAAVTAAGSAAGHAQDAAVRLQNAAAGAELWGDDPGLGQPFGDAFAGSRQDLLDTVRELPKLLEGLADDLAAARRGFADAEDSATTLAQGFTPGGGTPGGGVRA